MPAPREPLAKIPLTARKNVRDEFENKVADLKARMEKLGFPDFAFVANPNQVYVYADDNSYGQQSLGACIYTYFDNFIDRLSDYVKQGKDKESVEALKKVASKNVVNLVPDDTDKFYYCGIDIHDDQIWLFFNHDKLGTNIYQAAEKIGAAIDAAIDAQGGDDLPITVRRSIVEYLDKEVPEMEKKLEKIFNKPYTLVADVEKNYAFMKAHKEELGDETYLERLPEFIKFYWGGVMSSVAWKGFEKDDMLQEAFNEGAEKGVIRFQVVEKLEHGSYNDCVFEDGELRVRTIPSRFGSNVDSALEKVLDRL